MIIEEIVLDNFGIYKGHHVVQLTPHSPKKPIILLGGLNGSGKTTLLEALQLTLYGKFAKYSTGNKMNYFDYLRRMINYHTEPSQGASLQLQFKHFREGKEESIRIHRSWHSSGKGIKETVEVKRDGILDSVITERWYEYVEEFIPARISNLFFFDGEKIEALADTNKAAILIKTGIQALLGLDLVERLSTDLLMVERKRKIQVRSQQSDNHITALEAEVERFTNQLKEIVQQKSEVQNYLAQLEKEQEQLIEEYRREGGELFEERTQIEAQLETAQKNLSQIEKQWREVATGDAPLLMVQDLLEQTKLQAFREHEAKHNSQIHQELDKHDAAILDLLKQHTVNSAALKAIKTFMKEYKNQLQKSIKTECYLNTNPMFFNRLQDSFLEEIQASANTLVARLFCMTDEINDCERKLASIPDPESLESITQQRKEKQKAIKKAKLRIEIAEQEQERISQELERKKKGLTDAYEMEVQEEFAHEVTHHLIKHSERVRQTLEKFDLAVTQKHIRQLESLILDSFHQLNRKEHFINQIEIDPNEYTLSLYTVDHKKLSPKSLSAGERQLLAVSILWGLSRASGRPLPTIIDTPLSRLDGEHRNNLVDNYFHQASHQVILLSTDEEINEKYHRKLKSAIGREYHITYDKDKQAAKIHKGYFF
ncbi:MAG: DNA sulfur modification protein DndD [Gammaproteobacteria bacterium]|nr:MAG: DNA sulfur modification protein DndD [Gammaproteobacteria bacterium]RKZ77121.1 MAG: DNA sulfur modification protein DndD [Gammaproteobacteria bacterium]